MPRLQVSRVGLRQGEQAGGIHGRPFWKVQELRRAGRPLRRASSRQKKGPACWEGRQAGLLGLG